MSSYDFDDEIYAMIVKASVNLLLEEPFFGQLVGSLDLILCDEKVNPWCTTAATDGKFIYFNRSFVKSLTSRGLMFVLAHEVLHCLYDHLGRRQGRDPKVWNIANDLIVNYTLKKNNIGDLPPHGLFDERFNDEMHSEEVYHILMKNTEELEMLMQKGMKSFDQHLEQAQQELDDGDDDDGDQDGGQKGKGQDPSDDGEGSEDGDGSGDGDEDGEGSGSGDGESVRVKVMGDGPPTLTKQEADEVRERLKAVAVQAMQNALATAGNVPMSIRKKLNDLIEPKLDWRSLLDSHLRSAQKDDFTFTRMSRRDWGGAYILPAQDVLETVEVDIALDVSGSMSDEMVRDILSEVKGIMETFSDFKLRVIQFDTKVYGFKEFTPMNIDEIHEYERLAGGGTLFECVWEYWKKNDIEPHKGVMFTDGEPGNTWGDPQYCDMLFVIHGRGKVSNHKAPFGQTAYYEAPEKLAKAAWLSDGMQHFAMAA